MNRDMTNFAPQIKLAFQYNQSLAEKAVDQLADDQLRVALHPETNSVAVLMKHVAGNLRSRWTDFLTTDGEKPWRNRDDEFIDTFATRQELMAYWHEGWGILYQSLDALCDDDFRATVTIRGESLSVPLALGRSLSHSGYHVGQIVLICRILAGDRWKTLTIARGHSLQHNTNAWGSEQYRQASDK